MRLRRRYVLLVALLGVATAVLPAIASSETSPTVEAVNTRNVYDNTPGRPAGRRVVAGGVVTLRNPPPK